MPRAAADDNTITVDTDAKCPTCGKPGAIVRADGSPGPCMKCVAKHLRHGPPREGKGRAAPDWARNRAAEALLPPLRRHHPHLEGASLVVLMGPLGHAEGCKALGRARRLKTTERALLEALGVETMPAYVIETDSEAWTLLDQAGRLALLDHELCHMAGREMGEDGQLGDWKLRGHDLEEFLPVLQRHGPWRPALRDFCKVARQLDLPGL